MKQAKSPAKKATLNILPHFTIFEELRQCPAFWGSEYRII
jgi:hypothetical protein